MSLLTALARLLIFPGILFAVPAAWFFLWVERKSVAMMQGHMFEDPDAAWNAMMAAAIIYSLPPIAVFFLLRRYIAAGLTLSDAKA